MLPPSSTGMRGCISRSTLVQVQRLRTRGHNVVVVSGMRLPTFLKRLPFLPIADGYAVENGGRLFWNRAGNGEPASLEEDMQWREQHTGAGPSGQDDVAPDARVGALWDVYRQCLRDGFTCDASGYTTLVRVKDSASDGNGGQRLAQLLAHLPAGLTSAFNLGCADIFPSTSGKARVGAYIAKFYGVRLDDPRVVFLCDDDNDIELARCVGKAFVVTFTSPSMAEAVEMAAGSFVTPPPGATGTTATEWTLAAVEKHLDST